MDGMLYDLRNHYFVNFLSSEIKDITEAARTLLKRYTEVMNITQSFHILDIKMTGSMAEGTRIWSFDTPSDRQGGSKTAAKFPVIEFDFLVRLAIDEKFNKRTSNSCKGHMRIFKSTTKDSLVPSSTVEYISVSAVDVEKLFQHELMSAIRNLCNCKTTVRGIHGIESIRQTQKKGCQKCKVKMKSGSLTIASESEFGNPREKGCNLIFKWKSSACSLRAKDIEVFSDESVPFDVIYVLIDLLPSYALHKSECLLSNDGSRDLVPKACKVCQNSLCWRISNSREEKDIIQRTSEHHRSIFGALKVLFLLAFPKHGDVNRQLPSYHVKTSFLHHISKCSDGFVTTFSCLRDIFDRLSFSFQEKILCNYFTGHNLLEKHRYRHDDFCQKYSKCFEIIKQILLLADLLGDKTCCIDVMYPYLRNVDTMYISLIEKTEGLGDFQRYIRKLQVKRESVALPESKMKPNGDELSYSNHLDVVSTSRAARRQQYAQHDTSPIDAQSEILSKELSSRQQFNWILSRNLGTTNIISKGRERAKSKQVRKKMKVRNKNPKDDSETVASYLCMIM